MPKGTRGTDHPKAKLTEADVYAIRQSTLSQRFLATRYGVCGDAIRRIRTREGWKHLPEIAPMPSPEIWRPVVDPGFLGRYEASNFGRIRSTRLGRIAIRTTLNSTGYPAVMLYCQYKVKFASVHRLVAAAFLGPSVLWVNHKNGNKLDNRIDNLEYVTAKQNAHHAQRIGLYRRGEQHGRAKLTTPDVMFIRGCDVGATTLARQYGVTDSTIKAIRAKRIWKHLP